MSPVGVHLPFFGQTMTLTFLARKKNYARLSKSGTPSTSPSNLPTKVLSGGSIRPAAHQGGIWERLVRSFMQILYTILGTRRLTDKVLNTTFCLAEHALNSRPLTSVSANPSDLGAITPNHFLLGNQATAMPSIVGVDEFDHRKRYARAQSYVNTIWSRWIKEYLQALNRRSKWQTPAEHHLKTGDLVWVVQETNPRGYYPTARITVRRCGSDSVARSAGLRTSSGSLVRPFVKLVPILPTSSSGPEDVNK